MQSVVAQHGMDLVDAAHLFAMGDIVTTDAGIACFDSKFYYQFWRPITAIQNADKDGNPDTTADPTWQALLVVPGHPEYPSQHGCFTAAFSDALAAALHTKHLDVDHAGRAEREHRPHHDASTSTPSTTSRSRSSTRGSGSASTSATRSSRARSSATTSPTGSSTGSSSPSSRSPTLSERVARLRAGHSPFKTIQPASTAGAGLPGVLRRTVAGRDYPKKSHPLARHRRGGCVGPIYTSVRSAPCQRKISA